MAGKGLTREFLTERDLRIFKMRQAGVAVNEIARRFGVSTATVNTACRRQLERMNREALMAYPEVLRMELERLDSLQASIWPLTQHRKVTLDDGSEATLEPDMKAIQQVLSIMDRRSRLLGMEQTNVNLNVETTTQPRAVLAEAAASELTQSFDPESEARQLLQVMGAAGVLPEGMVQELLALEPGSDIVDAEIVEDDGE
jgi:hypothetical protein